MELKVVMNQISRKKKNNFGYLCRFVTRGLTLGPCKTYISILSSIVCFLEFLNHFLFPLESTNQVIRFYTKFWVKKLLLASSKCTSLLLGSSKPVQQNYRHFFKDFKPKCAFKELMQQRLLLKKLLIEIISELKATMTQMLTKKTCLYILLDSWLVLNH